MESAIVESQDANDEIKDEARREELEKLSGERNQAYGTLAALRKKKALLKELKTKFSADEGIVS